MCGIPLLGQEGLAYETTILVSTCNSLCSGVTPCEVGEYGCENGACIPDEQVCDGNADCADGTDEQPGCGCKSLCRFVYDQKLKCNPQ